MASPVGHEHKSGVVANAPGCYFDKAQWQKDCNPAALSSGDACRVLASAGLWSAKRTLLASQAGSATTPTAASRSSHRDLAINFPAYARACARDRAPHAWMTSKNLKFARPLISAHFALKEHGRLSLDSRLDSEQLKHLIREVPDFPKKGILFYDITTLLKDKVGFATLVDRLSEHYVDQKIDLVLGMEARGFIFAPALAYRLNAGFVPVRKAGKLPAETVKFDYALEYGTNSLEMHKDAIKKGQRVLIVDDLLATGGTAEATANLASLLGAEIAGLGFVVELDFLKGRDKLKGYQVMSLLHYDK
jgi:adenine phosphoribosyltransferase